MSLKDQLVKLGACNEALDWVGDKTIEEAWETCEDSEWMMWILEQTDLDLIDPVCNIAERVLHLVPEDNRLVCSNAISAARRRANQDELKAASDAAKNAIRTARSAAASCCYSCAYYVASLASLDPANTDATHAVYFAFMAEAEAEAVAADDNDDDDYDAADDTDCNKIFSTVACTKVKKNQCDILRRYLTIDQIKEALNKLVDSPIKLYE
jgi:hypothetical protein